MGDSPIKRIANNIAERVATAWTLLSETTNFLSRTPEFSHYEKTLREWRYELQHNANNTDLVHRIRQEIIELRKQLRSSGYDLALGSRDLQVQGFRNDSALQYGFARLVLYISETDVFYEYGQDNHIELARFLDELVRKAEIRGIRQRHYLWYLWHNHVLILSGSDTETRDDFEAFRVYAEANKLFLLQRLRKLP